MKKISQVLNWLSSLKIAILLLLLIAISCAAGTLIPQQESDQFYYDNFNKNPLLGLINGNTLILFEFNHIYTSFWFLLLLTWLVQASGLGPDGNENLKRPRRLRPIIIARRLINIEKKPGNWP